MPIPIENNSWDYVQGLIEKEINSAFKLRIEENKMEDNNFKKLPSPDDQLSHTRLTYRHSPQRTMLDRKLQSLHGSQLGDTLSKMKALDKVLANYTLLKDNCTCTQQDVEDFKIDILNSLF